jgi:hypothetical protein
MPPGVEGADEPRCSYHRFVVSCDLFHDFEPGKCQNTSLHHTLNALNEPRYIYGRFFEARHQLGTFTLFPCTPPPWLLVSGVAPLLKIPVRREKSKKLVAMESSGVRARNKSSLHRFYRRAVGLLAILSMLNVSVDMAGTGMEKQPAIFLALKINAKRQSSARASLLTFLSR